MLFCPYFQTGAGQRGWTQRCSEGPGELGDFFEHVWCEWIETRRPDHRGTLLAAWICGSTAIWERSGYQQAAGLKPLTCLSKTMKTNYSHLYKLRAVCVCKRERMCMCLCVFMLAQATGPDTLTNPDSRMFCERKGKNITVSCKHRKQAREEVALRLFLLKTTKKVTEKKIINVWGQGLLKSLEAKDESLVRTWSSRS